MTRFSLPPGRQGARVEVARGPDWSFMAWRNPRGLCVAWAAGSAENWARACGRPHTGADEGPQHLIVSLLSVSADSDGLGAVGGAVTPDVARVELELAGGTTLASATELAPAVTTDGRFFLVRVPASLLEQQFERGGPMTSPVRTYSFFAEDGYLLERYAIPG